MPPMDVSFSDPNFKEDEKLQLSPWVAKRKSILKGNEKITDKNA